MQQRITLGLLPVFVAVWIALGIDPLHRQDWLLENVLVVLVVPILVAGYLLPLAAVMALSLLYELIEWLAAVVFGGDLGLAYVGTQGDVWDAQKDMACAAVAALSIIVLMVARNISGQSKNSRCLVETDL